jgi:hypothetical protein
MRLHSKVALRGLRHRERVAKLAEAAPSGIRVVPQEKYRAVLKHPKAGGFAAEGGKEWPDDRFTKRRLADGSVTREAKQQPHDKHQPHEPQEHHEESRHREEHHEMDEPNNAA